MPAPGVIGRIAAKAMIGADAEEINKAAEKLVAQSEEEVQAYKEMVERQQLEERAGGWSRKRKELRGLVKQAGKLR